MVIMEGIAFFITVLGTHLRFSLSHDTRGEFTVFPDLLAVSVEVEDRCCYEDSDDCENQAGPCGMPLWIIANVREHRSRVKSSDTGQEVSGKVISSRRGSCIDRVCSYSIVDTRLIDRVIRNSDHRGTDSRCDPRDTISRSNGCKSEDKSPIGSKRMT